MVAHIMAMTGERGASLFGSIEKERGPVLTATAAERPPGALVVILVAPREPSGDRAAEQGFAQEPGWEDAAWQ
jgi:hypothetical protein